MRGNPFSDKEYGLLRRYQMLNHRLVRCEKLSVALKREIEELEFEEIEQITGLTANHIRVLLSRGRSKVKEMMRNER